MEGREGGQHLLSDSVVDRDGDPDLAGEGGFALGPGLQVPVFDIRPRRLGSSRVFILGRTDLHRIPIKAVILHDVLDGHLRIPAGFEIS